MLVYCSQSNFLDSSNFVFNKHNYLINHFLFHHAWKGQFYTQIYCWNMKLVHYTSFMLAVDYTRESESYLDMVDMNVYNEGKMAYLAERVCNEFYDFYNLVAKKSDVETFKEHFDKKAWIVFVKKCPDEYKQGYERFLPENASDNKQWTLPQDQQQQHSRQFGLSRMLVLLILR